MVKKKVKAWYKRWYMILAYCFVGLMIVGAILPNGETNDSNSGNLALTDNSNTQNAQTSTPTPTTPPALEDSTPTTPAVEENLDTATMGERNALDTALSYLDSMPFSYSGLIEQLEFEGYTHQEAVYGVDNCEADWNEQAALKAQSYLDIMAFSREGLIDQLEFEGFTREQAEYGVQAVGY